MSNSLSQTPAVKFHTYRHTSGALSAWKTELDILHMLRQHESLPTLYKYITEEGSDPRASVFMEMSGFHPGSQMLLYTFPGGA